MDITPYRNSNLPAIVDDWLLQILYNSIRIYEFLRNFAPIIVKYKVRQLGVRGIEALPMISWETKEEMKRWFLDYFDW